MIPPHLQPEYYEMSLRIIARHPISMGKIIDVLSQGLEVEQDKVETRFAKLTLNLKDDEK